MDSRLNAPPRYRFLRQRVWRQALIIGTILISALLYVVVAAAIQSRMDRWTHFSDLLIPRSIDVIVAAWLFYIGSSIGSFLNVVAWRMPRGVSINGRSHCPSCNTTLSMKDNWPVLGWLALAGRCRTCHLPISPRYPIVETCVGVCIAMVAWVEIYHGGDNLPFRDSLAKPIEVSMTTVTTESIIIAVFHAAAIAMSWAMGLVRFDNHRLPPRMVIFGFAITIVPMLANPTLAIVPWQVDILPTYRADGRHLDAVMRVITGAVAGVVIARSLSRCFSPTADPKMNPLGDGTKRMMDTAAMLCIPGIIVGWQAIIAVTVLAVSITLVWRRLARTTADPFTQFAVALPIALTVNLYLWRQTTAVVWWPSVGTPPMVTTAWAALILILPLALRSRPTAPDEGV